MGRFVVLVAIVAGVGAAGCRKPPPASRCAPAAPPAEAVKPSNAPQPLATLDTSGGERLAVVVLMVPGGSQATDPHEYKLSLAADADSAAVEVDGQPMGAARVQHLTPAALARLAARGAAPPAEPALVRPRPALPETVPARPARSRIFPTAVRPRELLPFGENANGAPIID